MASPPMTRARRARQASSLDRLPDDVLFSLLQLLPAKDICRLRAVCRSWRSITSAQAFIKAHTERHKEPFFLAKFRDDEMHVYVVDLSGNVVKRIAGADGGLQVLRTRLNLSCLATERNCCVLNPVTGGIHHVLPPLPAAIVRNLSNSFAFGFVASTGEYKLLRCLSTSNIFRQQQLSGVQVLTTTGHHARWRPKQGPPLSIDVSSGVVVDGVVYFLTGTDYFDIEMPADYILSFDLAGEEWRTVLHGPASTGNLTSGQMLRRQLTLADLKGSLVLAHHPRSLSIMDLWFLLDFESMLWVKHYSIRTESVNTRLALRYYYLIPLLLLDDGRLVIHLAPAGLLVICDPATNTFRRVNKRHRLDSVGVYTGNLLN